MNSILKKAVVITESKVFGIKYLSGSFQKEIDFSSVYYLDPFRVSLESTYNEFTLYLR